MGLLADRVREASTTTGTGPLTLMGAYTGCVTFASAFAVGQPCRYVLQAVDASGAPTGVWEIGRGTLANPTTLTRDEVVASSAGGALLDLAAGTKDVYCSPVQRDLDTYSHSQLSPASTWTIAHNLRRYPSVTVVDSSGRTVAGAVSYRDADTVLVTFSASFAGTAYLN